MTLTYRLAGLGPTLIIFSALVTASTSTAAGSYAGLQTQEIKALSRADVEGLLAGRGMGFAKPAELNGYPGPLHVLELAEALQLSAEQKARTQALIAPMQAQAKRLGASYVEKERELERLFASGQITPTTLATKLDEIAAVHAKLRRVHLETHLAQKAILSSAQIARYNELRGYTTPTADETPGHRHRRHHH